MRRHDITTQSYLRVLDTHWSDFDKVHIERRNGKYDRRFKLLTVMDDDQILREFWPINETNKIAANNFMDGYRMAKIVWGPMPTEGN